MNPTTILLAILLGSCISIGVDHEPPVGRWMSESPLIQFARRGGKPLFVARRTSRFADGRVPDDVAQMLLAQSLDLRPGANRNRGRTVTTGVPIGTYHAAQFSVASGHAAKTYAARKQLVNPPLITSRQAAGMAVRGGRGGWGRW